MKSSKEIFLFYLGNFLPFVQLFIFIFVLSMMKGLIEIMTFIILYIYVLPPLLFRLINLFFKQEHGGHHFGSKQFLIWWYGTQLQLIYARIPLFEELLRIPPFLYSAWLRCWGARIGKYVYWAPRIEILDRNMIEVGDLAVIGYGAKFSCHLLNKKKIFLAPIKIGPHSVIGGDAKIAPGCEIESNAEVPALTVLMPLTIFKSNAKNTSKEK
jgi:hypothetical protein